MKHRHHIIPKHMGGTDDNSNLTPPITIEEHAEEHRKLWEAHGHIEDHIAWRCLSGRITTEQARLEAAKIGQERSERYKESRKLTGKFAKSIASFESRSKGGKAASQKLIEWQKKNEATFKANCARNGKIKSVKQQIPHYYLGIVYPSKKALQKAHGMSNCGFYGKLNRGEIERLERVCAA